MAGLVKQNWHIFASILALVLFTGGLRARGLLWGQCLKAFLKALLSILLGIVVFYVCLLLAGFCSSRDLDTFYFCSPFFEFLFRMARLWDSKFTSASSILIPASLILLFLIGLASLIFKKRKGWEVFWLAFSLAIALKAQVFLIQKDMSSGLPLYLVSLSGAAFSAIFRSPPGTPKKDAGFFWTRWGLPLILLVALPSYFYRLGQHPFTVNDYEAENGISAFQIIQGDPKYAKILWGYAERDYEGGAHSAFFIYPLVGLFQIFGPSIVIMRSAGVLWAMASLAIFYFLIKDLLGRRAALLATFLASVCCWFVSTTHLGMFSSLTIFYTLLVIFLFMRALWKNPSYYPLAGSLLGFYSYCYVPARIIIPFLVLVWLHEALLKRKFFRKNLVGFVIFLACFFLFADLIADPFRQLTGVNITGHYIGSMSGQMQTDLDLKWALQDFKKNLLNLLDNIFYQNRSWVFPAPQAPLINRSVFLLALLGVGLSMGHWKQGKYFLFPAWLLLALLPPTLITPLVDRGAARRGILLIPPVCALAAITLDAMMNAASGIGKKAGAIIAWAGTAIFLFVTGIHDLNVYFNTPSHGWDYYRGDREVAVQAVKLLERGYHVEIILRLHQQRSEMVIDFFTFPQVKKLYSLFTYQLNLWQQPERGVRGENPFYRYWRCHQFEDVLRLARAAPRKEAILIFDSQENRKLLDQIRKLDPRARIDEFKDSEGRVVGFQYLIPQDDN